jgi:hypothetical protein
MKHFLIAFFSLILISATAQTNISASNITAKNILLGNYVPGNYNPPGLIADPDIISADIQSGVSADSLASYVRTLAAFYNRQTNTVLNGSANTGLNATNNWLLQKFQQFNANNNNSRLVTSKLMFTASICSSSAVFSEVFAILPGSDLADKSVIVIEGHIDSRNSNSCDQSGPAPGVSDNATGSALVIEAARILSKYQFKGTIVFLLTVGEEQGLYGGRALANYLLQNNVAVRMVMNNDIAATTYCGNCSSSPSCTPGVIADASIRIFSSGTGSTLTTSKQLARFVKLEYKEAILPITDYPMTINIMSTEDRVGRSSDHVPFRENGFAAIRMISQNENGNGSACGVVHTIYDAETVLNIQGTDSVSNVDYDYLRRNCVINTNAVCMAAQSVTKPGSFSIPKSVSTNKIKFTITDAGNAINYRITVRSNTDDWDSVYTVTGKTPTITILLNSNSKRYVSVAAVNASGIESLFLLEKSITVPTVSLPLTRTLELMATTEANNEISLNWQTNAEFNLKSFDIEYSEDLADFVSIGSYPAAGMGLSRQQYSFKPALASSENNFYRIKAKGTNGEFINSNIINVMPDVVLSDAISVYPNPVNDVLTVSGVRAGSRLQIIDITGKIWKQQKAFGKNSEQVSMNGLIRSMYFLKVTAPNGKSSVIKIQKL